MAEACEPLRHENICSSRPPLPFHLPFITPSAKCASEKALSEHMREPPPGGSRAGSGVGGIQLPTLKNEESMYVEERIEHIIELAGEARALIRRASPALLGNS